MPLCKLDDSSLYYRSHGNGEPVLLIHGLGGSGVDWVLQIPALERRFRVALLTDQPLLPYDQLACDTPTRAQAEFLSVGSRVLELLEDAGKSVPWAASVGGGRL
jgi:hypothetical protein